MPLTNEAIILIGEKDYWNAVTPYSADEQNFVLYFANPKLALYKNDDARNAVPLIERALRLGTGDAMVHYRAGVIYRQVGNTEAARYHFEQALANNLLVESRTTADLARTALQTLTLS